MTEELNELREQVHALAERLEALERLRDDERQREHQQERAAPIGDSDTFWALDGLNARLADDATTADGAVMLVGSLTLPTGAPVSWQVGRGTAGMLEVDWSDHAAVFAALGHPVRIELLRHILSGVQTTAELAQVEGLGTTGQLHHHLRQLVSAGWVRQSGRGSYEVPATRVVPLLVCVLGVER
ncbi:helix-turn-helix domain-containing protein [Microbacterium sp. Mu-80]|uniref:Helix-turn-helix domain-containing protein n=1 Tax=Microbacterium bandirmense TaxID=3122050 RepID=A0ABU8LF76_9MICO